LVQEMLANDEVLSSTEKMNKMFTRWAKMEASIGLIAYELWYNEVQPSTSVFHFACSLVCYRPYREIMCRLHGLMNGACIGLPCAGALERIRDAACRN
jgi:hypothetical protein